MTLRQLVIRSIVRIAWATYDYCDMPQCDIEAALDKLSDEELLNVYDEAKINMHEAINDKDW